MVDVREQGKSVGLLGNVQLMHFDLLCSFVAELTPFYAQDNTFIWEHDSIYTNMTGGFRVARLLEMMASLYACSYSSLCAV